MLRALAPSAIFLALAISSTEVCAQDATTRGWATSFNLAIGGSLTQTDWEITHPYVTASGQLWQTIFGDGNRPVMASGGVELRKGRIALQGNLGWMSSRLTLTGVRGFVPDDPYTPGQVWKFSSYQLEGALVYFPLAEAAARVAPYVSAGLGYVSSRGDTEMGGGSLSLSAGLRLPLWSHVALDAGIKARYLRLSGFDLSPTMHPLIVLKPVFATIGLGVGTR